MFHPHPHYAPKRPAVPTTDDVIQELAAFSEEIDELVTGDSPPPSRWPPGRADHEAMEKYWGPCVTAPISKAEEELRQYWRRNMCPDCHYPRGHSDLCLFANEMKQSRECTKPKSRPASASPNLSTNGTPNVSPTASPTHDSVYGIVTPSPRSPPSFGRGIVRSLAPDGPEHRNCKQALQFPLGRC